VISARVAAGGPVVAAGLAGAAAGVVATADSSGLPLPPAVQAARAATATAAATTGRVRTGDLPTLGC
jgi:hypothetical protein